jgi:hypothetical protein
LSRRFGALVCAVLVVLGLLVMLPSAAQAAAGPQITSGPTAPITVNPDVHPVQVTVSWNGGGEVHAQWGDSVTVVQPGVPTTIDFGDATSGTHPITVFACTTPTGGEPQLCTHSAGPTEYDAHTADVTVKTALDPFTVTPVPASISPNGDGVQDAGQMTVHTDETGPMQLSWELDRAIGNVAVSNGPRNVTPDANGDITVPVDPSQIEDGGFDLAVTLSRTTDELGTLERTEHASLIVDTVAPTVSLPASGQSLFPVVDGYRDTVTLRPGSNDSAAGRTLEVRDSTDTVVRTWTAEQVAAAGNAVVWNGRNQAGALVPAGTYQPHVVVTDLAGNRAEATGGAITVSHQHLVARTWDVVALARDVLARKDQTRCSTVRTPSLRGWRGSIGYYSNSRCKARSFAGSIASGVHAARLPSAVVPGTLTIWAYGGAAQHHGHSTAVLAAYDPSGDFLGRPSRLGSSLRWHPTTTRVAAKMLHGRDVAWNVFTSRGARYDVRGFRLVYRYQVLTG